MATAKEAAETLFKQYSNDQITGIEKLPQSGGDRLYFRIQTATRAFISAYSDNKKENDTFLYFSKQLLAAGAPVPEIFFANEDGSGYLQEDLGDVSLLNKLEEEGLTEHIKLLYKKSLKALAALQVNVDKIIDYSRCITSREFGRQAIMSDLLYFKYYFLDAVKIAYNKEKLVAEFERLGTRLNNADHKYFMFRDFQGRNVMVKNDAVFFIDYQGGMKGALQYDVASLLWQAKAALPADWKKELLTYYIDCAEESLSEKIDLASFTQVYNGFVMLRLLQVLGAYGFRGLFERKAHFLTSIPQALKNLKEFLKDNLTGDDLPEFARVLRLITHDSMIEKFRPVRASLNTPLIVHIKSFSYLKSGYPPPAVTGNGGGFVFDCRGILNPGRVEEHKTQTGRDKPVQDFLTDRTRMDEFLAGVFSVVDISVEDYIQRGFENLEVNFGCTGGQHRSVFAADALARHLRNKYNVRTEVNHIEQNFAA